MFDHVADTFITGGGGALVKSLTTRLKNPMFSEYGRMLEGGRAH